MCCVYGVSFSSVSSPVPPSLPRSPHRPPSKQVAKAQLDEDMCVEAIASYIKAEDPSYYAEVTW